MADLEHTQEQTRNASMDHLESVASRLRAESQITLHDKSDLDALKPRTDVAQHLPSLRLVDEKHKSAHKEGQDHKQLSDKEQEARDIAQAQRRSNGWESVDPPSVEKLKEQIGEKRIAIWGDKHGDVTSTERLANGLKNLKAAGIDAIAVEGFREGQQGLLDNWLAAKKGSKEEAKLSEDIQMYLEKTLNLSKDDPLYKKTMEVLHAAKDVGMKILAAEPNGGKITQEGPGKKINRDNNWQMVIDKYLRSHPHSKVLVYAGSAHFLGNDSFAGRESKKFVDFTPPRQYEQRPD